MKKFPGFEFEGDLIENPTLSPCGRFIVSPQQYGFAIRHTGGGCTAWHKVQDDGSYLVLTAGDDGVSHELGTLGESFALGFYADENDEQGTLYDMAVGLMAEAAEHASA